MDWLAPAILILNVIAIAATIGTAVVVALGPAADRVRELKSTPLAADPSPKRVQDETADSLTPVFRATTVIFQGRAHVHPKGPARRQEALRGEPIEVTGPPPRAQRRKLEFA